nr:2-amino-4-hydroxy-6-hydroxymethyldihydropteridine diphosphokinase [Sunxiuqinia sp.]
MHQVFLGIGGNIGNKRLNAEKIYVLAEEELGVILEKSSVYETPPWGFQAEENFWNQVLYIKTGLEPEELLFKIEKIEQQFGRKRKPGKYSSREMDIDILYFDDLILNEEKLCIPHPRIARRLFVLVPLVEIAPGFIHPQFKLTNQQLLALCEDNAQIKKIKL